MVSKKVKKSKVKQPDAETRQCRPKCKPSLHDCRVTLIVFTLHSGLTRIALSTNLPLFVAIASILALFFRPAHEILKLGPESLHRSKFIPHLIIPLAAASSPPGAETHRNNTLQIPIQTVHILKYLLHALLE
jgi:hypothetical protein